MHQKCSRERYIRKYRGAPRQCEFFQQWRLHNIRYAIFSKVQKCSSVNVMKAADVNADLPVSYKLLQSRVAVFTIIPRSSVRHPTPNQGHRSSRGHRRTSGSHKSLHSQTACRHGTVIVWVSVDRALSSFAILGAFQIRRSVNLGHTDCQFQKFPHKAPN